MSNFLPNGHELLRTEKKYWKMSEMKEGDNRLRFVMSPIAGWIDWVDNKPIRYRPDQKPSQPFNIEKPIKAFWACYVWDYSRNDLFILEISQMSVIKAIVALANDSDWGDCTEYDLKITKSGSLMKTRYQVTAIPHKELSKQIEMALESNPVCLEALYEGKDPWSDFDVFKEEYSASKEEADIFMDSAVEELIEKLSIDGMDTKHVKRYIKDLSEATKKTDKSFTEEQIAKNALQIDRLPKFKAAYLKDLEKISA
jgi:hypothetical protein